MVVLHNHRERWKSLCSLDTISLIHADSSPHCTDEEILVRDGGTAFVAVREFLFAVTKSFSKRVTICAMIAFQNLGKVSVLQGESAHQIKRRRFDHFTITAKLDHGKAATDRPLIRDDSQGRGSTLVTGN